VGGRHVRDDLRSTGFEGDLAGCGGRVSGDARLPRWAQGGVARELGPVPDHLGGQFLLPGGEGGEAVRSPQVRQFRGVLVPRGNDDGTISLTYSGAVSSRNSYTYVGTAAVSAAALDSIGQVNPASVRTAANAAPGAG
jgi:hypothetical protein